MDRLGKVNDEIRRSVLDKPHMIKHPGNQGDYNLPRGVIRGEISTCINIKNPTRLSNQIENIFVHTIYTN